MVKRRKQRRAISSGSSGKSNRRRGFDLLWGLTDRTGRGPKPALSLPAVISAAIDVVSTEGLNALTMARVASELDVTTMALYRYVPGKDDLIDLMIDAAFGTPPAPGGGDWRTAVEEWSKASLAMFRARPWLLELVMRRAPIGPNWLAWLNALLHALSNAGLTAGEMVAAALLVDGHVRSAAQISLAATGQRAENFGRVLQTVSSDARFPALARVLMDGGFAPAAEDTQSQFEFGLRRLMDGIDAFVRTRTRSQAKDRSIN